MAAVAFCGAVQSGCGYRGVSGRGWYAGVADAGALAVIRPRELKTSGPRFGSSCAAAANGDDGGSRWAVSMPLSPDPPTPRPPDSRPSGIVRGVGALAAFVSASIGRSRS